MTRRTNNKMATIIRTCLSFEVGNFVPRRVSFQFSRPDGGLVEGGQTDKGVVLGLVVVAVTPNHDEGATVRVVLQWLTTRPYAIWRRPA